jgi:hypothetical protein
MGEKGWLKEILEEVKKDVDKWPAWMRSKELEDIRKISADRSAGNVVSREVKSESNK